MFELSILLMCFPVIPLAYNEFLFVLFSLQLPNNYNKCKCCAPRRDIAQQHNNNT